MSQVIAHEDLRVLLTEAMTLNQTDILREVHLEDGKRTYLAHASLVEPHSHIIILHDITQLKELDLLKSQFIERVSQDIRSPLTTILGYAELMTRAGATNEQQKLFVERIIYSGHTVTALLAELLELGRIEADHGADMAPVHLSMIAQYAIEGLRHLAEEKHQHLVVNLPDSLPLILGNPIRLRQMIHHLLENAIKFTGEKGIITLRVLQQDDFLVLQIADNGLGIPVADQPHVFERFYRAKNTGAAYQGAGLGLSIVKNIVEKHNGRIWLESQESRGTIATVMLPIQNGQKQLSKEGDN